MGRSLPQASPMGASPTAKSLPEVSPLIGLQVASSMEPRGFSAATAV
ncbi:MAG: hypothetical protein H7308_13915 [Chthonomonadaceae bacterium]|nr:hypothetical protein [Chthonomonadaceae bacterium]